MKTTLAVTLVAAIILPIGAVIASAQSAPLSIGTWTTPQTAACPNYSYGTTCSSMVISCNNATPITASYASKTQANAKGTIVYFTGGAGTDAGPEDFQYGSEYYSDGFNVVQVIWSAPWENTNSGGGTYPYSIKTAACRPATFLNFVYTNPSLYSSSSGFCAQGASAGSGQIGYALAWYGAGNGSNAYHLDNAELIDGPMFSDVEQGCMETNGADAPDQTICPPGQLGCVGWPTSNQNPVTDTPEYIFGSERALQAWTNDQSCTVGPDTSGSNMKWLKQSIVDLPDGPNFTYTKTNIGGWLCATVSGQLAGCPFDDIQNGHFCLNNSTAQGQIFFGNFTAQNPPHNLSVNAINNCDGPEGVSTGIAPDGSSGHDAIRTDMRNRCTHN